MKPSVKGVIRFSVSLPPSLVRDFDEAWRSEGYDNRSKAAHDAFCSFVSEHKRTHESETVAGAIVLIYYLDKPGLLTQIAETQHKFEDCISSTTHVHIAKNKCLEVIAVKGRSTVIQNLSRELTTRKGVKELKLAVAAL